MSKEVPGQDRPLRGVRVIDFTMNLPGPYATMVLTSLGAEVIKVEPPRGDTARIFPRLFEIVAAGKKSVVLDLKNPDDQAKARKLVATADVAVEGFRPGVLARLGVDPLEATGSNPGLVFCSISGFGQSGVSRDHAGHDLNFQALTGVCHMMRDAKGRAMGAALPIADLSAALTASTAILAALYQRERTGKGAMLDVAMVDTLLSWAYVWAEGLTPTDVRLSGAVVPTAKKLADASSALPAPLGRIVRTAAQRLMSSAGAASVDALGERLKGSSTYEEITRLRLHALPHYDVYRTHDDRYLSVGIVDEDKFWKALCVALGVPMLGGIPMLGRFVGAKPLRRVLARIFARKDLAHWLAVLDRTAIPVAPVLTIEEALEDPQLQGRRPAQGHVHVPWSLAHPISEAAPELGADNEAILGGLG